MREQGTDTTNKGTDNAGKGVDNAGKGADNAVKVRIMPVRGADNAGKAAENASYGTDNAIKGSGAAVSDIAGMVRPSNGQGPDLAREELNQRLEIGEVAAAARVHHLPRRLPRSFVYAQPQPGACNVRRRAIQSSRRLGTGSNALEDHGMAGTRVRPSMWRAGKRTPAPTACFSTLSVSARGRRCPHGTGS